MADSTTTTPPEKKKKKEKKKKLEEKKDKKKERKKEKKKVASSSSSSSEESKKKKTAKKKPSTEELMKEAKQALEQLSLTVENDSRLEEPEIKKLMETIKSSLLLSGHTTVTPLHQLFYYDATEDIFLPFYLRQGVKILADDAPDLTKADVVRQLYGNKTGADALSVEELRWRVVGNMPQKQIPVYSKTKASQVYLGDAEKQCLWPISGEKKNERAPHLGKVVSMRSSRKAKEVIDASWVKERTTLLANHRKSLQELLEKKSAPPLVKEEKKKSTKKKSEKKEKKPEVEEMAIEQPTKPEPAQRKRAASDDELLERQPAEKKVKKETVVKEEKKEVERDEILYAEMDRCIRWMDQTKIHYNSVTV
jgi:hypothetical protein